MATQKTSFWLTSRGLAALGLIGAATYFLLIEHSQHVWQALPLLILLACPLIHLFMHGGHTSHSESSGSHQHERESDQDAYQRGLEEGRRNSEQRYNHRTDRK